VTWQVLSAADGHVTNGSFQFGLGDVGPVRGAEGSAPGDLHSGQSPVEAVADVLSRSANYLGLLLAVGLYLVARTVIRPATGGWPPRLAWLGAIALGFAALGTLGSMLVGFASLGPTSSGFLDFVTASRSGVLMSLRLLALLLGVVIVLALRGRRPPLAMAAGTVVGGVGVGLTALLSHAEASGSLGPVVAATAHLAGAGIWLSGIVCVVLLAGGWMGAGRPDLRVAVPRFSALALVAIGFVVATGVYAAWLQVGALPELQTPYGRVLVTKVAVATVAMGLGAVNLLDGGRNRPFAGGLPRRVAFEVGLAGIVVLLTANLTGGAPPRDLRLVPIGAVSGDEGVELALQDLPPGPNRALVTLPAPGLHVGTLELDLERTDATSSAVIPLGNKPQAEHGYSFVGDLILPANSHWSATVVGHDQDQVEVWRTRFAFTMGPTALDVDRGLSLDLGLFVALVMLVVALAGLGYWLGGGTLPWVHRELGRRSLLVGAALGVLVAGCLLLFAPII
jgi:copper transport protein